MASLPPLWQFEALCDQEGWPLSLWRKRMPQGLHRPDQIGHGAQPCAAYPVGPGIPDVRSLQEGIFSAPAPSPAWLPVQYRMVSASSCDGSHAPWRSRAAAWWRRQSGRGGRNLFWRCRQMQPVALKTPRRTPYTKGGVEGKGKTRAIVALVERGGNVRTFHVAHADKETVGGIVASNILRESRLHTDESHLYMQVGQRFAAHETVKHSAGEYARGDRSFKHG